MWKSNYSRYKETVFNQFDEKNLYCLQCGYGHERQSVSTA